MLLVTADDMRFDELRYLPNTRRLLCGKGTTFTGCRANVPLCSPARMGILTGQYSKHHGVTTQGIIADSKYNNSAFVAINNAGYRVGAIGKFISGAAAQDVKPGFDFWRCLSGSHGATGLIYDEYGYEIDNGSATISPTEYQDHYLAKEAVSFIGGTEPWCLWYNPTANHWPWTDPPNHTTEYSIAPFPLTMESDVSDKPSWVQAQSALTPTEQAEMQDDERHRLRELLAMDDAIGAMCAQIDATGQADDTTIIFTSDNGLMLGEHRFQGTALGSRAIKKNNLYDPALRVPLVCRGPGFVRQTIAEPTCQQDITRTMLAICGVSALLPNQAGVHLAPYALTPNPARQLLHYRDTAGDGDGHPSADGITTMTRKLIRHQGQTDPNKYEMYDLDTDPHELTNVAYVSGRLAERDDLENSLDLLLL